MAYAIIEYGFWGNPKIREAGKDAALMHIAACGYCNEFLTDGFISHIALETVAFNAFQRQPKKAIKALIEHRLWIEVEGGYQVNDYLKYYKSKKQIKDLREQKSNAGKASAEAKAKQNNAPPAKQDVQHFVEQSVEQDVEHPVEKVFNENSTYNNNNNKIQEKKGAVAQVFKAYEREIGVITSTISNDINDCLDDFPAEWFDAAFQEAARQNKRSWKYALAILKRWKAEGFQSNSRADPPKQRTRILTDPYGKKIEVPV